jgi:3-hydroxybutyryl-CoA dehydrogenase
MSSIETKDIVVVGAGLMGHGIALECAVAGHRVFLCDVDGSQLDQAMARIPGTLRLLSSAGKISDESIPAILERVTTTRHLNEACAKADFAIESVSEDLNVKQSVFRELDEACPPKTILASNSSSFMPSTLAAVTFRADRVLGTHYFNPPYLLPVVEVVAAQKTSKDALAKVCNFLRGMGKSPALVRKELPGFIGNRLQTALMREALFLVDQGVAKAEDIDLVVSQGFGRRFAAAGPFAVFEAAGWDLALAVASQLLPEINSEATVPTVLRDKVARGELGMKTGKGFYEWSPETATEAQTRIARVLIGLEKLLEGS